MAEHSRAGGFRRQIRRPWWISMVLVLVAASVAVAASSGEVTNGSRSAKPTPKQLLAKAKADARAATGNVRSFKPWSPGPAPHPKAGMTVGTVTCPFFIPACKRISDSLAEAGKAAGWKVISLDGGTDTAHQR